MGVQTLTFGCRLNAYEGEVMKAEAEKAGLDNAIIINTCAVTAEAVKQARQAVRKARRDNPSARIIVTGCAAQTEARSFGDMDEVDLVIGNHDKLRAESYKPMVFGADIIAGFPTETEAMFENSLRFITEADITYIHAFPYSPRPGTPAARMPQVGKAVAKERAARLRVAGDVQFAALCQTRIGRVESVLVERSGIGRTEHFLPVAVGKDQAGKLVSMRMTGAGADGLTGDVMRAAAR